MIDYKVCELTGFVKLHKGTFGIEVETEGENLPREDPLGWWKATQDPSLRGECAEYVLTSPFNLFEAENAVKHLEEMLADSRMHMSFRTSVHVHVNIQQLYMSQLKRFIVVSHLLENLLVEYSGEERIGNRFCLRVVDAEFQLEYIRRYLMSNIEIHGISEEEAKYAAINLVPIRRYGSVEFRSFKGTVDSQAIIQWLNIINSIYEFSIKDGRTCKELCAYAAASPEAFLDEVVGLYSNHLKFKGFEYGIREAEENLFFICNKELVYKERNEQKAKKPKAAVLFNEFLPDPIPAGVRRAARLDMDELLNEGQW